MSAYEQGLEAISKIEDAELKANLESTLKALNQDAGKAKGDITKIKLRNEELEGLVKETSTKASEWKEVMKVFADNGVDAVKAAKLAEDLKIAKSKEDENAELKRLLKEKDNKVKTYEEKQRFQEFKSKMDPILQKALSEFKDKDGNSIKIALDFIDQEALYKDLDLDSEVLVNDRLNKVLEAGFNKQQKFFENNGVDFARDVHGVRTGGDRHFSGNKGIDLNKINEFSVKAGGDIESVTQAMAAIRAARQKEKG